MLCFTGKERDAESGLDYFGARYFSSAQGRFTSADPKTFPHDFEDPQSWNKYGYTRNNPLRFVDPDGEDWKDALTGFANAFVSDNAFGANRIKGGNSDLRTGQAVGDAVAAVQGTAETLAGIGGEAIGTLLDFTGVGAAIGVPVNIVSGAAILHGGSAAIMGAGNLASVAFATSQDGSSQTSTNQPKANPLTGEPGSTSTTTHASGDPKQVRRYAKDGYPETDVDHGHDHGQGDPHAHDWTRPADGTPPTHDNRTPGRPVKPTDPQPE